MDTGVYHVEDLTDAGMRDLIAEFMQWPDPEETVHFEVYTAGPFGWDTTPHGPMDWDEACALACDLSFDGLSYCLEKVTVTDDGTIREPEVAEFRSGLRIG